MNHSNFQYHICGTDGDITYTDIQKDPCNDILYDIDMKVELPFPMLLTHCSQST